MDNRKALCDGSVLSFPDMCCTIESEITRGSEAIIYKGYCTDKGEPKKKHAILIKEFFPFRETGGIFRDDSGTIVDDQEEHAFWNVCEKNFWDGNQVYLKMQMRYPETTGTKLSVFSLNGSMYTVFDYKNGRTLAQEEGAKGDGSLKRLVLRMIGLLNALECYHEMGFLHMNIALDHILLIGKEENEHIMLINENYIFDMKKGENERCFYYNMKQGYTSPELRLGGNALIGPEVDLYSVAAVFYRCLTGCALTPFQMARSTPPDITDCEALRDIPETVRSMVRQILFIGLQVLPQRRYRSAAAMRNAFIELLQRIDGVGIAHWSLWELGKKTISHLVSNNPSLTWLTHEDEMFPITVMTKDGERIAFKEWIFNMSSKCGSHAVLTAESGMGKTTALLHTLSRQTKNYSPQRSAFLYISLYGWADGNKTYIRSRILEHLRYSSLESHSSDANQALMELLTAPLHTRAGNIPVLMLLLDGLDEVRGDRKPLIDEILLFSRLPGVGVLVASGDDVSELPFETLRLSPLGEDCIQHILSQRKLLHFTSETVKKQLEKPLLLSCFLKMKHEERLEVASDHDLIKLYISMLLEKEVYSRDETDELRFPMVVAVEYVMPQILSALKSKYCPLDGEDILKIAKKGYHLFKTPILQLPVPAWRRYRKAIIGDCKNAEEWCEWIIREILVKRLGLIMQMDEYHYQLAHPMFAVYF